MSFSHSFILNLYSFGAIFPFLKMEPFILGFFKLEGKPIYADAAVVKGIVKRYVEKAL